MIDKLDVEALEDLLAHEGWRILCRELHAKESIYIQSLLTTRDLNEIIRTQAYIAALRDFIARPKFLIEKGSIHENEDGRDAQEHK